MAVPLQHFIQTQHSNYLWRSFKTPVTSHDKAGHPNTQLVTLDAGVAMTGYHTRASELSTHLVDGPR